MVPWWGRAAWRLKGGVHRSYATMRPIQTAFRNNLSGANRCRIQDVTHNLVNKILKTSFILMAQEHLNLQNYNYYNEKN